MKTSAALPLFAMLLSAALPAQPPGNMSEDAAVRAVVQREIDAWEKFDPEAVSSCYTVNTTWPGGWSTSFFFGWNARPAGV